MLTIKVNLDVKVKNLANKTQIKAWVKHCLAQFLDKAEVHIDFVDAIVMQELNFQYRHKNYATNVLSFPESIPLPNGRQFLGNIILCPEVLLCEAQEQHKSLNDHLAHLLIHGCLHLLGYDHEKKADAKEMEALEIKILRQLGIKNPYE